MLMKFFMGYEDVLMASVKALAENETEKGLTIVQFFSRYKFFLICYSIKL